MNLVQVALPVPGIEPLVYRCSEALCRGVRVVVPLGNRKIVGVVISDDKVISLPKNITIREIDTIIDSKPVITESQFQLCEFVSRYYVASLGETLKKASPPIAKPKKYKNKLAKVFEKSSFELGSNDVTVTKEQDQAIQSILNQREFRSAFLLEGVTGSGKTEVYVRVAKEILAHKKSVLFIVPEIALTPHLHEYILRSLAAPIVMLHSGLTPVQRQNSYFHILEGKASIVVGARSALFSPLQKLGLIVVDEEHDASLKQEQTPKYHGRDIALWRARNEGAIAILGSATPSLESLFNVQTKKLIHLKLTKRIGGAGKLPAVSVIDLRSRSQQSQSKLKDRPQSEGQQLCIFSSPLKKAISDALDRREQVLLFLNRRGYAAFGLCNACGSILNCNSCSVSLTYYKQKNLLRCHQCNNFQSSDAACKKCGENAIVYLGLGTERIEKELRTLFKNARVARLDRDVARSDRALRDVLRRMQTRDIDVLVGTQMVTKGHDFHGISLVGIILADVALALPDFRASERCFQLITQASGRAGRGEKPGKVIIQTFNPHHPAIIYAQKHDSTNFSKKELELRKTLNQPPFVRTALIRIDGKKETNVIRAAEKIREILHPVSGLFGVEMLGPAPAPITKLRERFRYHIYLRAAKNQHRQKVLIQLEKQARPILRNEKCKISIDVDPINFL